VSNTNSEPSLPKATHTGVLKLGNIEVACCVLKDGTRLITQRGFFKALGKSPNKTAKAIYPDLMLASTETVKSVDAQGIPSLGDSIHVPAFLAADNIQTLVLEQLLAHQGCDLRPIPFTTPRGSEALGYRAELLPDVCNIWLEARRQDLLLQQQMHIAARCELLVSALAKVGIAALIDEATGYQAVRDSNALQKLLDRYLRDDLMRWVKTFPDELYRQWYRLLEWNHLDPVSQRPGHLAKITNRLVYNKLLPNLSSHLCERRGEETQHRLHQYLSDAPGRAHLERHIFAIANLGRACENWDDYVALVDRVFPDPAV
jgi:P63C domain